MDKRNQKQRAIRAKRQGASHGAKIQAPILDCTSCPSKNNDRPSFRFGSQITSKMNFSELTSEQQLNVLRTFQSMEQMSWQSVNESGGHGKNANGLGYGPVKKNRNINIPDDFPKGKSLTHFRASGGERIFGFRDRSVFHISWFDPNHDTTG